MFLCVGVWGGGGCVCVCMCVCISMCVCAFVCVFEWGANVFVYVYGRVIFFLFRLIH